jgi:pyruvate kinase (EC 2.7.1.40)
MRRTKIVCTIGPASDSEDLLGKLIDAGMNVARLNFSHGTHEEHGATIRRIRSVSDEKQVSIAILQDLAGPKIRVGKFKNDSAFLEAGQTFVLSNEDVLGDENRAFVSYQKLTEEVKPR